MRRLSCDIHLHTSRRGSKSSSSTKHSRPHRRRHRRRQHQMPIQRLLNTLVQSEGQLVACEKVAITSTPTTDMLLLFKARRLDLMQRQLTAVGRLDRFVMRQLSARRSLHSRHRRYFSLIINSSNPLSHHQLHHPQLELQRSCTPPSAPTARPTSRFVDSN